MEKERRCVTETARGWDYRFRRRGTHMHGRLRWWKQLKLIPAAMDWTASWMLRERNHPAMLRYCRLCVPIFLVWMMPPRIIFAELTCNSPAARLIIKTWCDPSTPHATRFEFPLVFLRSIWRDRH